MVTEKKRAARVRDVVSRWPRWLRIIFLAWLLVGLVGFLLPIPLAIFSAAFDAPSVISAGPIPAAMDRHLLLVALGLGLPLGLPLLFGEQRDDWNTWRAATYRGFLAILVGIFIWLVGGLSAMTITEGLALGINAVAQPPSRTWTMQITAVGLSRSTRNCPKNLYFDDPIVPGHRSKICVYQLDPLFQAGVGDVLHLSGQPGPFGITYQHDDLWLEKVLPVSN